jgi:hypothetical protein
VVVVATVAAVAAGATAYATLGASQPGIHNTAGQIASSESPTTPPTGALGVASPEAPSVFPTPTATAPPAATAAAPTAPATPTGSPEPKAQPTAAKPAPHQTTLPDDGCLTTLNTREESVTWVRAKSTDPAPLVLDMTIDVEVAKLLHACPMVLTVTAMSNSGSVLTTDTYTAQITDESTYSVVFDFSQYPCVAGVYGTVSVGTPAWYTRIEAIPGSGYCG